MTANWKASSSPNKLPVLTLVIKSPPVAHRVFFCFVVASFGTVKRQFHEARKRNYAAFADFFADHVGGHFHCLQSGMALISVAVIERIYG